MLRSCSHFANKRSKEMIIMPTDNIAHLGVNTVEMVVLFQCPLDCFYVSVFPVSESSMQNLTLNWANQYQFEVLWVFLSNIHHF